MIKRVKSIRHIILQSYMNMRTWVVSKKSCLHLRVARNINYSRMYGHVHCYKNVSFFSNGIHSISHFMELITTTFIVVIVYQAQANPLTYCTRQWRIQFVSCDSCKILDIHTSMRLLAIITAEHLNRTRSVFLHNKN